MHAYVYYRTCDVIWTIVIVNIIDFLQAGFEKIWVEEFNDINT